MYRALIAMHWVGIILLASAGCKTQPDLKPPPQPEVLASPGPNDNRYVQPASYPPDTLANDPFKAGLNGITPANAKRGGAGGSMGPANMGGPGG
jgi:hypothetical protein